MIKLRITLESKQDVIREIAIDSELNLEQLHQEIIKHFKFLKIQPLDKILTSKMHNFFTLFSQVYFSAVLYALLINLLFLLINKSN